MNMERKRVSMAQMLSEDAVSDYLHGHHDFLVRWLSENVTRDIVELFAKKLKERGWDEPSHSPGRSRGHGGSSSPLAFRKTAQNSITSQIFRRYLDGARTRSVPTKKDRKSLERMSEEDLFMELIRDIASELDVNMLCHKILQNVSILTNSDRSSLFLVRGSRDNKHLVSKLFDVTETSTVEDAIHTESNEIKVPFGKGIVGIVAQTAKAINISDAYEDPRFNQEIDRLTGYRTHSILSMPIINYEGEVIGVAQIINKVSGNHEFTQQDEDLFRKYLIFCGIGLTNAQLFEMSVNEFKRNQLLLHLARGIFEEQTNLEKLVQKIMLDAQDLLKCEKCCVYLLEDSCERDISRFTHAFLSRLGSYSRNSLVLSMQGLNIAGPALGNPQRVFTRLRAKEEFNQEAAKLRGNGDPTATQKRRPVSPHLETSKFKTPQEVVFSKAFDLCSKDGTVTVPSAQVLEGSKTAYIAKFVVTTGEPVNVADADADGRFGQGPFVDTSGSRIKSVLCMPIHNSDKSIIGVTQLINKINGQPFNDNDVNIIEAFSIFTGLGIHNCQMYENACQLMAKQSVALEVLSFHATAHAEETHALLTADIPTADRFELYSFDFDDHLLDDDGTLQACVRMFMEANVLNTFKVPYDVLTRWLCTVKKNYRPVTYHNWRHAFNVCQTMFVMLFTGELRPLFEDLEIFALLAACLCHDLDHRGTNNAFQVKVASPLAMLYSTSVLEHHHFDHCIMILNSEGNNIFQSLTPEDYRRAIKLLEHAILSTDLALYFKKRGDFKKLVEAGEKTFVEPAKRSLLRAMMMTACDVAAITKPWDIQQETAQLVTAEFFEQGDIERHQLGEQPIPMMDRNKKDELPKMQVGFIDAICAPVYKMFAVITQKLEPLHSGCENNRQRWQELAHHQTAKDQPQTEAAGEEKEPASDQVAAPEGQRGQGGHVQQVSGSGDASLLAEGSNVDSGSQQGQASSDQDHSSSNTTGASSQHDTSGHQQLQESEPPSVAAPAESTTTTTSTSSSVPPPQPDSVIDNVNKQGSDLHTMFPAASLHSQPRALGEVSLALTHTPSPSHPVLTSATKEQPDHVMHMQSHATVTDRDISLRSPSGGKHHHQNGSATATQKTRLEDSHTKQHSLMSTPLRWKRKTHAQAHAHSSGDKTSKRSGVCLIS